MALLSEARKAFHHQLVGSGALSINSDGVASIADGSQKTSRALARSIAEELGASVLEDKLVGQSAGSLFEIAVRDFLSATFPRLSSIRPGKWEISNVGGSRAAYHIARYEPYTHLDDLAHAIEVDPTLRAVLGNSYEISPDVMILRGPASDAEINSDSLLVDEMSGLMSVMRGDYNERSIVHGIVSCKWTLRSDRAQNARSEALNMIRNRKGRTPHIVVVTAEPMPNRLASLALGTGDIDCVYHFALYELIRAVKEVGSEDAAETLETLVQGKRLKDISDLPLDLAV